MSLRLPAKVPFAIIGDEKCPNGSVRIVGAKIAFAPVESAELAIWPARLENWPTHRRISQSLRQTKIFRLADVAELRAVLSEMLFQLRAAAESRPAGEEQQADQQKADCKPSRSCSHVLYYTATAASQDIMGE